MNTTPTTTNRNDIVTTKCDLPDAYNEHGVKFKVTEWATDYPNNPMRGMEIATEYSPSLPTERTQNNGYDVVCAPYMPNITVYRRWENWVPKGDDRYGSHNWRVTVKYELGGEGYRSVGVKEKRDLTDLEASQLVNDLMAKYRPASRNL